MSEEKKEEKKEHDLTNGGDCWCEPHTVLTDDGKIWVHTCDICGHYPCQCTNKMEGGKNEFTTI